MWRVQAAWSAGGWVGTSWLSRESLCSMPIHAVAIVLQQLGMSTGRLRSMQHLHRCSAAYFARLANLWELYKLLDAVAQHRAWSACNRSAVCQFCTILSVFDKLGLVWPTVFPRQHLHSRLVAKAKSCIGAFQYSVHWCSSFSFHEVPGHFTRHWHLRGR